MFSVLLLSILGTATTGPAQPDAGQPAPTAPPPVVRKDDVVLRWNEVLLRAIKADRTPPPQAARNMALVHAAIYDAVNAVQPAHRAFRVDARATLPTAPEAAAAIAAHRTLVELYPGQVERFDRALDESMADIADGQTKTQGMVLGNYVAEKVLDWRREDGSRRRAAHRPGTAVGVWRPTPPDFRPGLLPQWPAVAPFAVTNPSDFRAAPPPALTSREYTAGFQEVKGLGARDSTARTAEQTLIARFWADGDGTVTPPGHWNRIAQEAARQRGNALADNARLFALLNVSLADAGIVCWDCKFHYALWRPITAIRHAGQDDNPDTEPDPDWAPLLTTPPFPSYTSGHSTFSGAAAAALASFFGTDEVRFTTTSEGTPGVTRSFARFSEAAAEAGRSRIYGGIHYEFDNAEGLKVGRSVADYVARNYFQPRAEPTARETAYRRPRAARPTE
jgi:PAP2 superfamily